MTKRKYWFIGAVVIVIIYILGFVEGCTYARRGTTPPAVDTVTFTVTDTQYYDMPVPVDSVVLRYEYISLSPKPSPDGEGSQPDTDPLPLNPDTTALQLPITQKKYQDSTYTAYVSGYHPSLDSIFIYQRHTYTTVTQPTPAAVKKKHWGIGVQLGAGWNINSATHPDSGWNPWIPAPYIGVGISYNFITF